MLEESIGIALIVVILVVDVRSFDRPSGIMTQSQIFWNKIKAVISITWIGSLISDIRLAICTSERRTHLLANKIIFRTINALTATKSS